MVKEVNSRFCCEECNMHYEEKHLAQKCEDWCKKHHSCNIEIIKFAVP